MTDTSWNIRDLHVFYKIFENNQTTNPYRATAIQMHGPVDSLVPALTSPQERNKESSAGLQDTHVTGIEWPG